MKPKMDELIGNNDPINEKKLDVLNFSEHRKENFLPCAQPWASVHINNDVSFFRV